MNTFVPGARTARRRVRASERPAQTAAALLCVFDPLAQMAASAGSALVLLLACASGLASDRTSTEPRIGHPGDAAPQPVRTGPAASDSVAVLDFAILSAETNRWRWAQGGVADLLQIELEQLGWVMLDRDLIHAVLAEQRLASVGLTANDQLKVGSLLHARYLVTGKVLPREAERVRLEVTAFAVETVEAVATATGEGELPKELASVLSQVARQLAGRLQSSGPLAPPSMQAAPAPKPEALIMFYRGLNACARGEPELAAPWFMNAASLDTEFTAPLLWEIKAYELAGFERHAAIRREETADVLKGLGLEVPGWGVGGNHSAKPVLAVLDPVLATLPATGQEATPLALAATLKQALLATGQVRLFAFENLGEAVAEQDLKLSSLFARQYAPRYGRWLASDALVVCHISCPTPDQATLDLALVNPFTAGTINRVQRAGPANSLLDLVRAAAPELVGNWRNNPAAQAPVLPSAGLASSPGEEGGVELRPAFRGLAAALARARREPTKSDSHRALADAFAATGRPRLAAHEIERCLERLDIRAPNADKTYLGTHRWLFWEPSPASGAAGLVDPKLIGNLIQQLLTTYPESLAAGCLHYNLAVTDWSARHWQAAAEHAARARQIIQPLPGHEEFDRQLLGATFFLEGASLSKLGKLEDARSVVRRGLDYMRDFKVRDSCLPLGPWISDFFGGVERVSGFGGDAPGIRTRLERELVLLEGKPAHPTGLDLQRDAQELVAATATNAAPPSVSEAWLRCAEQVAGLLGQTQPGDAGALKNILASAGSSLSLARMNGAPATALRPLVHECVATLLAKQGLASFENATSLSVEQLTGIAVEVMSLHESAGFREEAWAALQPLFSDRYPVELTLNLLQQLNWDPERSARELKRAAARLPAGAAKVSGAAWLKLGNIYARDERYREALGCYQKALAQGVSKAECPGLVPALLEVALDRNLAHPREEIEKLRRELGLPPVEASWVEWFAAGRKYCLSRQFDLDKAIVCYRNCLEFLEHPEQGGIYRLEKQPGAKRTALRWGPSLGEVDLAWSDDYDSRWYSPAFYLAQCLMSVNQKEEAAQWLRRIALKAGGDAIVLLDETSWNGSRYQVVQLGVRAADQLKELHLEPAGPKFGEADGPYKRPAYRHKARSLAGLPPLPTPNPEILQALTNTLAEAARDPRSRTPNPRLQTFIQHYGHDAVPALLSLLPRAGELWDESALGWMLGQTAAPAEAPYVVAASKTHWGLIAVASKLDLNATAELLADEWRSQSEKGFVNFFFIFAVLDARVRPLYPLALDHIAETKVNHHSVVFRMDQIVNEEEVDELEAGFREALSHCLKLKLQRQDSYELPRISQIALRHGVPEAIEGLLVCEGSAPEQLLRDVRPYVDLPPPENEALELLRANAGKWEWEPGRKKFTLGIAKK